jgi:sugar-specific transcriptional regulator TrmB
MKSLFRQLGINDKEMYAFLKLLELGAQPASVIAKYVEVPRSTMYLILDNLKKNHLIEEFNRGNIKYFKCISVRNIEDVLKAKIKLLESTLDILKNHMSELESLENRLSITPKVKFFEGKEAVMKVYEEVLKEKEFLAFFNPYLVKKCMPEYHFKIPETLKATGGKARELLIECEEAHEYKKLYNSKKHQIRILPKNDIFESDTIICSEKIYMISYGESDVCATEIYNKSLAQTQKVVFEEVWKKN